MSLGSGGGGGGEEEVRKLTKNLLSPFSIFVWKLGKSVHYNNLYISDRCY